jgi:uncharacterized membrane protein
MADKERLDIISSAIAGLLKRQEALEERLARIEHALALGPPQPPQRSAEQAGPVEDHQALLAQTLLYPSKSPSETNEAPPSSGVSPPPATQQTGERLETEMGLRWVNRVGAFTLVLAVAFFFKLAVDNQWIGPAGRVILGVLSGFGTLAVADMLWRRGHVVYAQGVSGMGIAILYLSFYASFGFYQLVPHALAFLLMVSCTGMACALALRYGASAIAFLGLLGGYAVPVLLSTDADRPWIFFTYILLLDAGAVALDRIRGWRRLSILALASTIVLSFVWGNTHFLSEKRLVATVFDLAFYALFVTVPSVWFLIVPQTFATVTLGAILTRDTTLFAFLLLAISLSGLAISDRRRSAAGVQVTVGASWLAYAAFYTEFTDFVPTGALLALATALFLPFFLWVPWRIFYRILPVGAPELVVVVTNAAAYFVAGYVLLETNYEGYLGLFAVGVAVPYMAFGIALWRERARVEHARNAVLIHLGVALALVTLAVPIQFTGLRITIAWMLEGAALVWIGRRASAPRFLHAGWIVFVLGYFRLFAIDAWIYTDRDQYVLIWNARFMTFAVSTACSWLAAFWMRPHRIALVPYAAGHVALFWILSQEAVAWARRISEFESAWNAQSAALSILWALYAVILVATGVVWRIALHRRAGLILLSVVVAKLYLSDIWQLPLAYRVTAFASLGVLLLLTSFLYSKYRNSIATWWRNERPEA